MRRIPRYQAQEGFRPPRSAIPADTDLQVRPPADGYGDGRPIEWYVDDTERCKDCGDEFVFSAQEQQYWYEVLRIPIRVWRVRCEPCARKRRVRGAVDRRLTQGAEALAETPDDPGVLVGFAEVSLKQAAWVGSRDLRRAITAAVDGYRRALACRATTDDGKRLQRSAAERLALLEPGLQGETEASP